jgi:UDP-N-acetyl-D-glucosamine/UDP-N-acetyl-D-galactosamine dehydrogenase
LADHNTQEPADAIVLAVAHDTFIDLGWPFLQKLLKERQGLVLDVKSRLDRLSKPVEIELWRL